MVKSVSTIYRFVVDDVVSKMKAEFVQEGVDESVLMELRELWEGNMMRNGLLDDGEDGQEAPVHGEGSDGEERAAVAAEATEEEDVDEDDADTGSLELLPSAAGAGTGHVPNALDTAQEGRKRKLNEHGLDLQHEPFQSRVKLEPLPSSFLPDLNLDTGADHYGFIPQQDGNDDDLAPTADEAAGGDEAAEDEGEEDNLSDLSSDADEEEDDDNLKNFLCAQFERVTRTKNRWKCIMKDGVFHIEGKDYLFHKATGEFNF